MKAVMLDSKTLDFIQSLVHIAASKKRWKTVLDKLLSAVREKFLFDNVALYVVDANTQTLEIVYARAMGRGKSAEADADWGVELANQVLASDGVFIQEPIERMDDRLSQAYILGMPIEDGLQKIGAIIFIRFGGPAFTAEQTALAEIAGNCMAQLIQKKVQQEFRQEFDVLQQKALLQDDFIATISHELRTPLGFIKGYSTTLLRSDTTWTDENRQEFLTIIDEEADRLTQLIENILESAKFQSRSIQLQFQPLRLDALIRDTVNRIRTRYKELEIALNIESLPPIQGDNVRLTQVFENLFSNAIKYAPDSKIVITAKKNEDSLLVTFADKGKGIPDTYLPYLFDRFYRVPGEHAKKGSGLGLYICNHIVMAHHGKIWVESEIDKGTTFYIELPISQL